MSDKIVFAGETMGKYWLRSVQLLSFFSISLFAASATGADRPLNVILIMTDDQGYGDVGIHGNPQLRTPHLDRLAREGVRLDQFHVSPVCTPTRASLMTGRYNYRTRAIDTYLGRAMMDPSEITVAEILRSHNYRTGIFGKWHLGDCYPLRAMDHGFQESLVHGGGGITQPGDVAGNHYLNPTLSHNGRRQAYKGYCSDVFTQGALDFIAEDSAFPFFVYLAFNAPHTPLEVPAEWITPYQKQGLDEKTARVYAMVANIDENIGRIQQHLHDLELQDDTLVIFLTDNGPHQARYNAGMRGLKGTLYQGGIRVPCFLKAPGKIAAGKVITTPAAHIDLMPTILSACQIAPPPGLKLDGVSLWKHLLPEGESIPERPLFFQWHRGDVPLLNQSCALRRGRFKLVQSTFQPEINDPALLPWELFDLESDPNETTNLASQQPQRLQELRDEYRQWFADASSTRGYDPPRIVIGNEQSMSVTLTRQDWRGPQASWSDNGLGHWEIEVAEKGSYGLICSFPPEPMERTAQIQIGSLLWTKVISPNEDDCGLIVTLPIGPQSVKITLGEGESSRGPHYVMIDRLID